MFRYFSTIIIGSLFSFFCLTLPAMGEFYRYTDKDGVSHFTDNLSDVPIEQRKKMERLKEVKKNKPVEANILSEEVNNTKQPDIKDVEAINDRIKALNIKKKELDKKFEDLSKKQQALIEDKNKAKTVEDMNSIEERTTVLNEQIAAYENERLAYEKERQAIAASADD